MLKLAITFSPLELCDQGRYTEAAEQAGLGVGEWPENRSGGHSEQAERLLAAGVITSYLGGIQQTADQATAREMLKESIRLFGDDPRAWVARSWLARTYYWSGDFEAALELSEEVLSVRLDSLTRFRTHLTRAGIYSRQRLSGKALDELEEIRTFYDTLDPLFKGQYHNQRGRILRLLNETDRAIVEYDGAAHFFREAKDPRCHGIAANNLAGIYLETGQYEKAHDYAEQARELFLILGDKTYQAESWDQTAQIFLDEGKLEQAERAVSKGISLVEFGEIRGRLVETLDKIKNAKAVELRCASDSIHASLNSLSILEERSIAMTPLDCVSLLIHGDPHKAVALLDLLLLATNVDDPKHEAEIDRVKRMAFSRIPEAEEHREEYEQRRLGRLTSNDS